MHKNNSAKNHRKKNCSKRNLWDRIVSIVYKYWDVYFLYHSMTTITEYDNLSSNIRQRQDIIRQKIKNVFSFE